jgi:C1A family cysteine protease
MFRTMSRVLFAGAVLALSLPAQAQDASRAFAGGAVRTIPRFPLSGDDRARLGGARAPEALASIRNSMSAGLPRSSSVRHRMTGVRDQGSRGTCSAHATLALFEAGTNLNLSEQCLTLFSSSQDSGFVSERMSYAFSHGLYTEDECPYSEMRDQVPALGRPSVAAGGAGTMLPETSMQSLQTLKQLIVGGRPVAISVWVSTQVFFDNANTVIDAPRPENNLCSGASSCGGHAVAVVGYDDDAQVLTFKNSWGTGWKDGGYGRMTYKYFLESYMSGNANRMVAY